MVRKSFMVLTYSHVLAYNKYLINLVGQPKNKNRPSPIICTRFADIKDGASYGNFCNICDKASVMQFVNKRLKRFGLQNDVLTDEKFELEIIVSQGGCNFKVYVQYYWDYRTNAVRYEYSIPDLNLSIGQGYASSNVRSFKAIKDHFSNYMQGLDIVSISTNPLIK